MCSTLTPVYGLPQYSTLRLWQDGKSCGSRDALSAFNEHGLIIVHFPSCHTSTVLPVITGQTRSLLSSRACSGDGKGIGPWTAFRKCLSVQLENNAALLFTILLFSLMRCCLFIRFHHTHQGSLGACVIIRASLEMLPHFPQVIFFLFPFQC